MSLLTPERVPVKVYKWDDVGAPALDKTAGCMMTIFKACLVTGYGTKESAGWTMPFEDTAAGVKVFRPEISPHTDFYLRLFADTGTEMTAQVYLNMTNANTGDLKLQCDGLFTYGRNNTSSKWVLIATTRGFKFFFESASVYGSGVMNKSGGFLFVGDISGDSIDARAIFLQHSIGYGGTEGDHVGIFKAYGGTYAPAKLLTADGEVKSLVWTSLFTGYDDITNNVHLSQVNSYVSRSIYVLQGVCTPSAIADTTNYTVVNMLDGNTTNQFMAVGVSGFSNEFLYVAIDSWVY